MYMIWQVIVMNGQQRRAVQFLVSLGEATTTTVTFTPLFEAAAIRLLATAALPSVHFCTCSTER